VVVVVVLTANEIVWCGGRRLQTVNSKFCNNNNKIDCFVDFTTDSLSLAGSEP